MAFCADTGRTPGSGTALKLEDVCWGCDGRPCYRLTGAIAQLGRGPSSTRNYPSGPISFERHDDTFGCIFGALVLPYPYGRRFLWRQPFALYSSAGSSPQEGVEVVGMVTDEPVGMGFEPTAYFAHRFDFSDCFQHLSL